MRIVSPAEVLYDDKGDEEAFLALLADHHGFERVDIRPANLVALLDLDRVPVVEELVEDHRLALARRRAGRGGGDGEDAAVEPIQYRPTIPAESVTARSEPGL